MVDDDIEISDDGLQEENSNISATSQAANEASTAYSSIVRKSDSSKEHVPLWLITFTDVMALMLTFFVLLYSMSVPQEEKWEEISTALSSRFSKLEAKEFNSGSQDVISIDKIDKSKALDLKYIETLIVNLLKSKSIDGVILFQNEKHLVISLPSELLFKSGSPNINLKGKKLLFALGGILHRVKNRIEIAGHTDPVPINGDNGVYITNRELSLARASSVAAILRDVGYTRHMTIRGMSSARYDEMSENISEERRYSLSRRVDIIVMNDDGFRVKLYSLQ